MWISALGESIMLALVQLSDWINNKTLVLHHLRKP